MFDFIGDAFETGAEFIGDATKTVFGGSKDPGLLGLGKQQVPKHDIDKNNFQDPKYQENRNALGQRLAGLDNRQAPVATAAQQQGVREYAGAQTNMAPWAQSQGVSLGNANTFTAAQGQSAGVNRGDLGFRQSQATNIQALESAAAGRGPSLAEETLKQGTDRALKQQLAAAATTGGNPALARRNAALQAAATQRQAGIDSVALRLQEQQAARSQLGGALDSARGQEIGVNTTDAGLTQQMALANLGARNQVGLANAGAQNQFALTQGQMDLQNNQLNANSLNQRNQFSAGLEQQAGLSNQAAFNEMLARNTQNQQQTNLQNLQSQLQTMGMNDAQIRYMLGQQLLLDEQNRAANITYEQMRTQQDTGMAGAETSAYQNAAKSRQEFVANLTQQAQGGAEPPMSPGKKGS